MHRGDCSELTHLEEAFSIGVRGPVMIVVWRGRPTRAGLGRNNDAGQEIARRIAGPVALLVVIEEGSPPPDVVDMPIAARGLDGLEGLACSAVVLEGRATLAPLLEGVSRVQQLTRRRPPAKFCADPIEAATWLVSRPPARDVGPGFRDELLGEVERVRARLDTIAS